jgi:hypothetical protein
MVLIVGFRRRHGYDHEMQMTGESILAIVYVRKYETPLEDGSRLLNVYHSFRPFYSDYSTCTM